MMQFKPRLGICSLSGIPNSTFDAILKGLQITYQYADYE
jgi:hypothetical protein